MTRVLGLDIGTKRTGVAVSDELGLTARPLLTLPTDELAHSLPELLQANQAETIVVGRPRRVDGELGKQAEVTERIVTGLRETVNADWQYEDETATTISGDGSDESAACVMLQGYLHERA